MIRGGLHVGKWLGGADGELLKEEATRTVPRTLPGTNDYQLDGEISSHPSFSLSHLFHCLFS